MLNGKAISTTLLSRDTYDAMTRIIIKGTGAVVNPTPEPEPSTETPKIEPSEPVTPEEPITPQPDTPETPTEETKN